MASRNLTLGKGFLHFAEFKPGTQTPGGERWIGNSSTITINGEVETLAHTSSTGGRRQEDYSAVLGVTRAGTIVTDDMNDENVAIYAMGIATKVTQASAASQTDTFEDVEQGLTYQVGVTDARPEGARKITTVVVQSTAATPVVYALGDDYTVDLDRGRVTIVEDGAITDVSDIEVNYSISASTITKVEAGSQEREGQLRFISNNPDGPQRDYLFPWVKLSPNADLNLISEEEWQTLGLAIKVLEKGDMPPWIATGEAVTS